KDIVASSAAALVSERVIVGTPFSSQHTQSQKLQKNYNQLILNRFMDFSGHFAIHQPLTRRNLTMDLLGAAAEPQGRNILVPKRRNMR
ncbi:hypothetical protein, partial [Rhizobium sp.]|uniref:hypothetical protein n=1 Tax=Rhizobium sp. TaxID=391 RepID=UPI0028AD7E3A